MRKLIIYGIILFQLILIASLVKGLQVSSRAKVRLTDLEKDKQKLMEANEQLKKEEEDQTECLLKNLVDFSPDSEYQIGIGELANTTQRKNGK